MRAKEASWAGTSLDTCLICERLDVIFKKMFVNDVIIPNARISWDEVLNGFGPLFLCSCGILVHVL